MWKLYTHGETMPASILAWPLSLWLPDCMEDNCRVHPLSVKMFCKAVFFKKIMVFQHSRMSQKVLLNRGRFSLQRINFCVKKRVRTTRSWRAKFAHPSLVPLFKCRTHLQKEWLNRATFLRLIPLVNSYHLHAPIVWVYYHILEP